MFAFHKTPPLTTMLHSASGLTLLVFTCLAISANASRRTRQSGSPKSRRSRSPGGTFRSQRFVNPHQPRAQRPTGKRCNPQTPKVPVQNPLNKVPGSGRRFQPAKSSFPGPGGILFGAEDPTERKMRSGSCSENNVINMTKSTTEEPDMLTKPLTGDDIDFEGSGEPSMMQWILERINNAQGPTTHQIEGQNIPVIADEFPDSIEFLPVEVGDRVELKGELTSKRPVGSLGTVIGILEAEQKFKIRWDRSHNFQRIQKIPLYTTKCVITNIPAPIVIFQKDDKIMLIKKFKKSKRKRGSYGTVDEVLPDGKLRIRWDDPIDGKSLQKVPLSVVEHRDSDGRS